MKINPAMMLTCCQIALAISLTLVAISGFGISYFGEWAKEDKERSRNTHGLNEAARVAKEALANKLKATANALRISLTHDLTNLVPVANGLYKQMISGKFGDSAQMFSAIYSRQALLPSGPDIGFFSSDIVAALELCRIRIAECDKHRNLRIQELQVSSGQSNGVTLLMYCISLDSVILTEASLLETLNKEYAAKDGAANNLPVYHGLDKKMIEKFQSVLSGHALAAKER